MTIRPYDMPPAWMMDNSLARSILGPSAPGSPGEPVAVATTPGAATPSGTTAQPGVPTPTGAAPGTDTRPSDLVAHDAPAIQDPLVHALRAVAAATGDQDLNLLADHPAILLAIAEAESGLNPLSVNDHEVPSHPGGPPRSSFGAWQIITTTASGLWHRRMQLLGNAGASLPGRVTEDSSFWRPILTGLPQYLYVSGFVREILQLMRRDTSQLPDGALTGRNPVGQRLADAANSLARLYSIPPFAVAMRLYWVDTSTLGAARLGENGTSRDPDAGKRAVRRVAAALRALGAVPQ